MLREYPMALAYIVRAYPLALYLAVLMAWAHLLFSTGGGAPAAGNSCSRPCALGPCPQDGPINNSDPGMISDGRSPSHPQAAAVETSNDDRRHCHASIAAIITIHSGVATSGGNGSDHSRVATAASDTTITDVAAIASGPAIKATAPSGGCITYGFLLWSDPRQSGRCSPTRGRTRWRPWRRAQSPTVHSPFLAHLVLAGGEVPGLCGSGPLPGLGPRGSSSGAPQLPRGNLP